VATYYDEDHFDPLLPPEEVHPAARFMLVQCPVVHSDMDGGFWVVSRHADLMRIMQDQPGFASGNRGVRVPHEPVVRPPMPPIDNNPPIHRQVRQAINPFLSPQELARREPEIRAIIRRLVEALAEKGSCDLATELAKVFPAQVTLEVLFGIEDPAVLEQVRMWVRRLSYDQFKEDPKILGKLQEEWTAWCRDLLDVRRRQPRRADIVDALMNAEVDDGRHLTDDEVIGGMQILLLGGFSTTSDATSNIVIRLIEDPDLEAILRARPELIPDAIEEVLRLDPPVTARPRRATSDVEVGGRLIRKDDRVLCFYLAANLDEEQFEDPETFNLHRARNKVVTFGAGPHRCIGSNMARLSLKVMVEELLAKVTNIRFAGGAREERVSFNPSTWRAVDHLPIVFDAVEHPTAASVPAGSTP
jgi:cytochrome P450